ncbi:hypothetical protein JHK87_019993 [Glycine soja]|nr:hypothetical protein JHK87_019993 [Glycine soja]
MPPVSVIIVVIIYYYYYLQAKTNKNLRLEFLFFLRKNTYQFIIQNTQKKLSALES